MHFTEHEKAVLQMPDLIPPDWRSPLIYLSGALEIAAGALILAGGRWRRIGAGLSILLLVGLAPAIVTITFIDKAFLADAALNMAFRYIVFPHALLIAWLSVRIWRSTPPPLSPSA
jgi:uncharacterized membrane protein